MRIALASVFALTTLLGCSTQSGLGGSAARASGGGNTIPLPSAPVDISPIAIRVGVEYLPAAATARGLGELASVPSRARRPSTQRSVQVLERVRTPVQAAPIEEEPGSGAAQSDRFGQLQGAWILTENRIETMQDPVDRFSLTLVSELMGNDRRRMHHRMGPSLVHRSQDLADGLQQLRFYHENESSFDAVSFNNVGRGLLRRPIREALKGSSWIGEVEGVIEDFKADNVPTSDAYQDDQPERRRWGWGRFSMRLRINRSSDPLELAYKNWGMRIGSGQQRFRFDYGVDLTDRVRSNVNYFYFYDGSEAGFNTDLTYDLGNDSYLVLVAGDQVWFPIGSIETNQGRTAVEGSRGVLFFFEHLF